MDLQGQERRFLQEPWHITQIANLFELVGVSWFKSILEKEVEWYENCLSWQENMLRVLFSWMKLTVSVQRERNQAPVEVTLKYNERCLNYSTNSMDLSHSLISKYAIIYFNLADFFFRLLWRRIVST